MLWGHAERCSSITPCIISLCITSKRASLLDMAEKTIVESLGEQAKSIVSRFCCGGTLNFVEEVKLLFEKKSDGAGDGWSCVTFPVSEQTSLKPLLDVCSVASFGLGDQQVTDKSYRDALKLDPDRFETSLHLCNTQLLFELQNIMMPDMCHNNFVRAELYKLNIYSGPGGHFKAHVDTPRSSEMFGSLVVCLPTQFTGGELVTRHKGQETRFDWSSTPQSPMKKVAWAAFFSDVEHEVLPVTDGHRCTLTYNLYCLNKLQDLPRTVTITPCPFYCELRAAVSNPHFMCGGGVLGFSCQHQYVFTDFNFSDNIPHLLKGADNIVFVAAAALGLHVSVKPFAQIGNPQRASWYGLHTNGYLLSTFSEFKPEKDGFYEDNEGSEDHQIMKTLFGKNVTQSQEEKITWCQDVTNFKPAAAYATYGNDAACEVVYQAACILVDIPEWGEKRQGLPA